MDHHWLILAVPGLPLLAAIVIGLLGPRLLRGASHWPAILAVGGSAAAAAWLLFAGPERAAGSVGEWISVGGFDVRFGYNYDPLSAVMLFTVTLVGLLVTVYSRGYMHGHRGFARFFVFLCLFVFSMCTLVLADNLLLLFFGWEAVGVCSYLLIGFYYERPVASAAARKAFIVNRVGDFGLMLGVLLTFATFGSVAFATVLDPEALRHAGMMGKPLHWIALLLLCGAMGKSAQLLLHVWLPDAMAGPSPASALIHAATMVTAGVYLVARVIPLFGEAGMLPVVAVVGGATALFAATIALVRTDLKQVLAYSTISQLGYMFLGLGAGAAGSAIFHLFTHAFFKALLFLGAGAVMHAMADVLDLRRMGGLFRPLRLTAITFLAGCLALAGIPGTSGYFSKDQIIGATFEAAHLGRLGPVLGWVALLTAGLTAFYTFRLFMRVFTGPLKLPEETHGHVHAPGPWMWMVLAILAAPSLAGGLAGGWMHGRLEAMNLRFDNHWWGHPAHPHWLPWVAGATAIGAALLGVWLYGPARGRMLASGLDRSAVHRLLSRGYYVDELYGLIFVAPARALGRFCVGLDERVIAPLLYAIGRGARAFGRLFTLTDDRGIDSALIGITWAPRGLGRLMQLTQRSSLGGYALVFVVGAAGAVLLLLLLGRWML